MDTVREDITRAFRDVESPLTYSAMTSSVGAPALAMVALLASPKECKELLAQVEEKALSYCESDEDAFEVATLRAMIRNVFRNARKKR